MRFIVSQYCCSWWSRSYDCMQNIVSMGSGEKYWTPCWILVAFVITNSRKDRLLTLMILMYCVVILWDLSQERYLLQDNKYLQEQFDDVSSIMNISLKTMTSATLDTISQTGVSSTERQCCLDLHLFWKISVCFSSGSVFNRKRQIKCCRATLSSPYANR